MEPKIYGHLRGINHGLNDEAAQKKLQKWKIFVQDKNLISSKLTSTLEKYHPKTKSVLY